METSLVVGMMMPGAVLSWSAGACVVRSITRQGPRERCITAANVVHWLEDRVAGVCRCDNRVVAAKNGRKLDGFDGLMGNSASPFGA